jgi:hypothetical protein
VGSHLRWIAFATAVVTGASVLALPLASAPAEGATSCTGVQLAPGANLQNAINSNGTNTTFCLTDGGYSTTAPITPRDGDRFIGVYTDATQPNIANTGTGGVFSGGRNNLYQDLDIGPSRGTGVNPGSGSTIIGTHIHHNQMCGIETAANSLTITGNEIGPSNGTLANKGDACGIKLHGLSGSDSGAYNSVTNNSIHDNMGHALWVDCDGHDNTFSGNSVYNNAGAALDDETSYNDSFTNNIVHDNGFGWSNYAVNILDSMGTNVSGNTLTHNYRGVNVWADKRATLNAPRSGLGCANISLTSYHPSGIAITNNTFPSPQRSGFASTGMVPLSAVNLDNNCWTVAALSDTNWRIPTDSTATWSQWQAAGKDRHGWAQTGAC